MDRSSVLGRLLERDSYIDHQTILKYEESPSDESISGPRRHWLHDRMCAARLPLEPFIIKLIKSSIESSFSPWRPARVIPEGEIYALYSSMLTIEAKHVLMLYYIILFNERAYSDRKMISIQAPFSDSLANVIPIKSILGFAERHDGGKSFKLIFPHLASMVATQFLELWDSERFLDEEDLNLLATHDTTILAKDGITEVQPWKVLYHYEGELRALLSGFLSNPDVSLSEKRTFRRLWAHIGYTCPRELWMFTARVLCPGQGITQDSLINDPIQVLDCNTRVFDSDVLTRVLLETLRSFMLVSRYRIKRTLLNSSNPALSSQPQRENTEYALLSLQETEIIQRLLDICYQYRERESSVAIIYKFLHQLFINNPTYIKLVHFQGYRIELIKDTVKNIPSMHVCLDFVTELLKQPDEYHQSFGIHLMAQLAATYPIAKSLQILQDSVFHKIRSMTLRFLDYHEGQEPVSFETINSIIPTLSVIWQAFPFLQESITSVLKDLDEQIKSSKLKSRFKIYKVLNQTFQKISNPAEAAVRASQH
ncbi:integrator complex subunit 2-domain-containing protein [Polychytrium aggregatum]|uniref:integrator complex subunit 2-domain-containing protein n=1 Tax=Polychytrium aggregatum TaxID=110093 RepID=UPI0022FE5D0A|nr:integrator complex subunit 2-domain-containing protein [Polychytrium aggregatum]KAI9193267.1 integrator complex subunit 2-domain-containing protein [Polychytrium aggregatum]